MAVKLVSTGVQFPDNTIQTTASSGGGSTVDLVAASGITAASPLNAATVALRSDGKIEAVAVSSGSASVTNASYNNTNSYTTEATDILYVPAIDKCITFSLAGWYRVLHVISHSGDTASFGSTLNVYGYIGNRSEASLAWDDYRDVIMSCSPHSSTSLYSVYTISGTTITHHSTQSTGVTGSRGGIAFSKKNNLYVGLMSASNRRNQMIMMGTLPADNYWGSSATHTDFKIELRAGSTPENYDSLKLAYLETPGVMIACYINARDSFRMGVVAIDPLSRYKYHVGHGVHGSKEGIEKQWPRNIRIREVPNTNCFLFAYANTSAQIDVGIGSVTGVSASIDQVYHVDSGGGSNYTVGLAYDPDTRRVLIAYMKTSGTDLVYKWGEVDPVNKLIIMDSSTTDIDTTVPNQVAPAADWQPTIKRFVVNTPNVNFSSNRQLLSTINIGGGSNKGNFIGMVESSISQNATGEVKVGGIVELGSSANLTENSVYYVQNDGSLGISQTSVRAGRAIKSDRLLLNG